MTLVDFERIEVALQVVLPDYYKAVLLTYPPNLEKAFDYELLGSAEKIIKENLTSYQDFWGKQLNKKYLIIGKNGCGDYFFIELKKDSGVYGFLHDNQTFYCLANSLKNYCTLISEGKHEMNLGIEKFKTIDLRY